MAETALLRNVALEASLNCRAKALREVIPAAEKVNINIGVAHQWSTSRTSRFRDLVCSSCFGAPDPKDQWIRELYQRDFERVTMPPMPR
jgi:hypothetical protein